MTACSSRERSDASADTLLVWRPEGLSQDLLVPGGAAFLRGLTAVVDWPGSFRPVFSDVADGPLGRSGVLEEPDRPGRYLVASPYLDEPMRNLPLASALCALVADLTQADVDANPGTIGLHCGAFRAGAGLVAVTGAHRAGKSTLIARLTAEPMFEVFCDDVLPLTPKGEGIALGIAPRLRLPLHDAASDDFRAHVAACLGPRDDRYGFLCPPGLAPHGARAPLSTIIVLDRRGAATPAQLEPLDPGEAFGHLIARNLGLFDTADGAIAAFEDLLSRLVCLRLVHSDLEEAVELLRRAFGQGATPDPALIAPPGEAPPFPIQPDAPAPADPDQPWHRAEGVAVRRIGQAAVLWRPGEAMVWHLNLLAHAAWEILGEGPISAREMAEMLAEVFPAEDPARICEDLARLFAGLAGEDLVERVSAVG